LSSFKQLLLDLVLRSHNLWCLTNDLNFHIVWYFDNENFYIFLLTRVSKQCSTQLPKYQPHSMFCILFRNAIEQGMDKS